MKIFCVRHWLLQYTDYACNRRKRITGACDIIQERYGVLFTTERKRAGYKACCDGSPATSVRKANFVVKVVVLELCENSVPRT